ncbi:hypothetical protein BOTBODRAFT_191086 [Botryobasidium botryosum FD-172 SS1]|uniref:Uncharacterized protein n=1 Tax=Botryobasidium botryosum (strain FD-172 SS1) TaxID=930990 RepID=A0A067M429_BOTB1|nr:hypothetical protein BOTBODRAFT_191086 [Botryobasidium botryosum FD-172 SS1]
MPLPSLSHDILSYICSLFKTRRSLLNLALTCRTLHSIVIPTLLYERLDFPRHLDHCASFEGFQSFVDLICAADSTVADAIPHIEILDIKHLQSFWTQSIPLMRNLCNIDIPRCYTTLKWLSHMPHLHTLLLHVKFARDIGVPLQRAVIYALDDYIQLNPYLPPDNRSVKLEYGIKCTIDPLRQLEELATVCRKVVYLVVDCELDPRPEDAFQLLSNSSVECLSFSWPFGGSSTHHKDRHSRMEGFAARAFQLMSAFGSSHCVRYIYNRVIYWRRTVGVDGILPEFSEVSDEEGPDYPDYHGWRWRDQPEYTTKLDEDA